MHVKNVFTFTISVSIIIIIWLFLDNYYNIRRSQLALLMFPNNTVSEYCNYINIKWKIEKKRDFNIDNVSKIDHSRSS